MRPLYPKTGILAPRAILGQSAHGNIMLVSSTSDDASAVRRMSCMQMFHKLFFSARWLVIIFAFTLLVLSATPLSAQSGAERFYYFQGARVPLTVNPRLVAVRFDPGTTTETQKQLIESAGALENFDTRTDSPAGNLVFIPVRAGQNSIATAERLSTQPGVQFASPVYDVGTMQLAETDEFLARFKTDLTASDIAAFNQLNGVTQASALPFSDRVWILKPDASNPRSAREMANAYVEAGVVEFAEPNFVLRETAPRELTPQAVRLPELAPNDTAFQNHWQWGLQNTGIFQSAVVGADINAVNAWNSTQGASNIVIAVIDEGVDASHPDLAGKVLAGRNTLFNNSDTTPKIGDVHGTAVAGVAAANSNNALGVTGVCWYCKILPVKVAERDTSGNWTATFASLASGIDWAWQNGADVLNNSWTMSGGDPSGTVLQAILNARTAGRNNKGSTILFASGNENNSTVSYPGSLNSYVIAVGASNWCDQRKTPVNDACNNNNVRWGSNYGSALDLVAPGEAIYSTCNVGQCSGNSSYAYFSGTSFAAPFVSGVVGLLYSLNPNLTPTQVQQMLQNGAKDLGAVGRDNETGYGRLDAYKSIAQLYNLNLSVTDNRTLARAGESLVYTLSYANTGSTAMGSTVLTVTLPAHTTYLNSSPAFSAQGGGVYKLNLGTLAGNATGSATFRVQVQPSAAGQKIILNTNIAGAFPESNTADNAAGDTTLGIQSQIYLPLILR